MILYEKYVVCPKCDEAGLVNKWLFLWIIFSNRLVKFSSFFFTFKIMFICLWPLHYEIEIKPKQIYAKEIIEEVEEAAACFVTLTLSYMGYRTRKRAGKSSKWNESIVKCGHMKFSLRSLVNLIEPKILTRILNTSIFTQHIVYV